MRGTVAKRLRKQANEMSVGLQYREYEEKALNPRRPTHRTRFLYNCTKLIMRNLKKRHYERWSR